MNGGPWEDYYERGSPGWRGSPYPLPDLPAGSKMLDLGCGTGPTLIKGLERGFEVTGIDISGSALKIAGKRLKDRDLQAELLEVDLYDPFLDPGRFDLITVHYVLGAVIERKALASRITGWLEKGGTISFEDLAAGDIREGKGSLVEDRTWLKGNGILQHFFVKDEVTELFGGLEEIHLSTGSWKHGRFERKRIRALYRS